jgi:uncharacterized membrane protein YbhN (UPF0104 family)
MLAANVENFSPLWMASSQFETGWLYLAIVGMRSWQDSCIKVCAANSFSLHLITALKKYLISGLKFLLFLSIGLGILYYAYYAQNQTYQLTEAWKTHCEPAGISVEDCELSEAQLAQYSLLDKLREDFGNLHFFWIFVSIMAFLVSNLSRAIRWGMLIKPLGRSVRLLNSYMAVMVGYMSNSVVPRAGELVRCGVLSRYEKLPLNKVLGTVAMSRSLDVLCLLIAMGLMLLFEFDSVWGYLQENAFAGSDEGSLLTNPWVLGFLGLMLLGGVLVLVFWKRLLQIPFFSRLWGIVLGFWEGLRTIGKLENPWAFVFHTVNIWVMYYLMHYVAFFAFDQVAHLPPGAALTIFVFGSLGIVIPAPGGIGAFQYLVTQALLIYGIAGDDAFSFSNVIFFPIFFTNIILGAIALGLFPALNKHYQPEGESLEGAS